MSLDVYGFAIERKMNVEYDISTKWQELHFILKNWENMHVFCFLNECQGCTVMDR